MLPMSVLAAKPAAWERRAALSSARAHGAAREAAFEQENDALHAPLPRIASLSFKAQMSSCLLLHQRGDVARGCTIKCWAPLPFLLRFLRFLDVESHASKHFFPLAQVTRHLRK